MDSILIKQPAGLGDIFFTQKIAHTLAEHYGCRVTWPVLDEFIWVKDYLIAPNVDFVPLSSDFKYKEVFEQPISDVIEIEDNCLYLPLQHADWQIPGSVMEAKYKIVNMDFDNWADYFDFNRNEGRERDLFDLLELTEENYIVTNRYFGSGKEGVCTQINFNTPLKVVEVDNIPGFTLFDWSYIMQCALQIHTVDTSWCYLFEKLALENGVNMYSRYTPSNWMHIKNLFKSKWVYHN
jgi:hypothetical protein